MMPLLDFFSPGAGVIGVLALGVTGAAAGVGSVELKNGLLRWLELGRLLAHQRLVLSR